MDYKKFIDESITTLIHEDGSDLHLGAGRKPAIRVNGQLIFLVNQKELNQEDMVGILKIIIGEEKEKLFFKKRKLTFLINSKRSSS